MVKIVFVGEAWGRKEDLFSHPLVGASGQELARMLASLEIGPELAFDYPSELDMIRYWKKAKEEFEIEVTNVFCCRPPYNNIEDFFAARRDGGDNSLPELTKGKYVLPAMRHHVETLWARLETWKPNIIVALGNTACWATLGETKITQLRGTVKVSPRLGIKVLPTYHPAAILRQPELRTIVLRDLDKVGRESLFNEMKRIERWLTIEPTLGEIRAWLNRPADYYAVDIENLARGHISMIGFARAHNDALVIPFVDETKPGWNYWPTVADEIAAIRLVDRALKKPVPKIFQNGIYDLTHLLRFGYRPTMVEHDSMLLHHSLYPEMLKGLGFLGSIYSEEIAWKSMRTKGNNLKRDE
jgi:uracil-DNA glycosylase